MGIFTKKREESNVIPAQGSRPEVSPVLLIERERAREPEPEPVAAPPRPEPSPKLTSGPDFGIQNAMELMRKLPPDNIPLVVSVVKTTLESLAIDVESIIEDAKVKRAKIAERISGLEAEIADLEEEVAARREEIKALRDDAAETKLVQERLQMATGELAPPSMGRPELTAPLLRPPGG
jgi:outer membrane murein-binding lipoprotein Lpp